MTLKKCDIILIFVLLIAAFIIFILIRVSAHPGSVAAVYEDGVKTGEYSLSEDGYYTIETASGENVLVVEDGSARMISADCPDKLCVNMGAIKNQGENIICLPHKLVIQIEGDKASVDYDIK